MIGRSRIGAEKGERPARGELPTQRRPYSSPQKQGASRRYGVLINFIEAEFMQ
jgi:hypothetical protein